MSGWMPPMQWHGKPEFTRWDKFNLNVELTKSQETTVKLLAHGMSYKEIAAERGISYRSVQDMLVTLYRKTNCQDRYDMLIWCIKKGLLKV